MTNVLFICLAVGVSLAAGAAQESDDAKGLQGVWIPVKAELGGQPMPDAVLKTITLKIKRGEYEVSIAGEPGTDKGTWTLDTAAKPKGMKIMGVRGPNAGKVFPAIYELNSDVLRVCYDLSGTKRPAEFKTSSGTQLYLVTYNRKKQSSP